MATRLDRLFVLLDQGSSQVTRRAAATQLGEVQRLHPHELNNLLSKVRTFLHSNNWDTRIAAGQAIEAIISNVPLWLPSGIKKPVVKAEEGSDHEAGQMTFDHFDINAIIDKGKDLLASEGSEFDLKSTPQTPEIGGDWKEKVVLQRRLLNSRLGLSDMDLGVNSEDLVSNDDLMASSHNSSTTKRKLSSSLIKTKKIKKEVSTNDGQTSFDQISCDRVVDLNELTEWPIEWFADELMNDLFNAVWEVRHGAATGLREVVKLQGNCAGRKSSLPTSLMESVNQSWLEDLSLRLICVLALDKFGDFVSDQVVAPVRESAAQALGSVFHCMNEVNVERSMDILVQLLSRPEWEARHGGLLGLKYLLAVRLDMTSKLLPKVFNAIFARLEDSSDDVSSVAAAALVPVKDTLVEVLPEAIDKITTFLWDFLLTIDDLTSSTSSTLTLLSSLLAFKKPENLRHLNDLLPRLWPFLGHSMSAVRKSVLEAILTLSNVADVITDWMNEEILKSTLGLVFQQNLIDPNLEVRSLLTDVWRNVVSRSSPETLFKVTCPFISGWICLVMHPTKLPIDTTTSPTWINVKHRAMTGDDHSHHQQLFLGGSESLSDGSQAREAAVLSCRMSATRLLGILFAQLTSGPDSVSIVDYLSNLLLFHLSSKSSIQRFCGGLVLTEWAKEDRNVTSNGSNGLKRPDACLSKCLECLNEGHIYYDEVASLFGKLQQEVKEFVVQLNINGIPIQTDSLKNLVVWTFDQINQLLTIEYPTIITSVVKSKVRASLDDKSRSLSKSLSDVLKYHQSLLTSTSTILATAAVAWRYFPDKLNPLIRPLMESVKKEEQEIIQDLAATYLARLLWSCPSPAPKVIKNLVTFATCDPSKTPTATKDGNQVIITLVNMQKISERNVPFKRSTSKSLDRQESQLEAEGIGSETETQKELMITTRGASRALTELVKFFGSEVPSKLDNLWSMYSSLNDLKEPESIIQALQVIEVTAKFIHTDLRSDIKKLLPTLCEFAHNSNPEVRHMTSRVFGQISTIMANDVMSMVVDRLLADMNSPDEIYCRGAVEVLTNVIDSLGLSIVPFIVLLVVPMLSRMSDQCDHVRLLATHSFAQLIQLMPLDDGTGSVGDENLKAKKLEERKFLEQLTDPKRLEPFKLVVPVKAELRSYQQQGLNWLAFLNRYRLHGILCDEMGLGKTLMSISILACDHHIKKESDLKVPPSLVICPPTLTGHWVFEVSKFVDKANLNPIHYTGSPADRNKLRDKIKKQAKGTSASVSLVVASYDIVRNDIDFFGTITWNYCILDEGHIIKNGKTKLSKAVKSLTSGHRLILTGTPIQNNVLELWSLFDFLMPGFLGSERQFMVRYSKPILASRDAKSSSKEQEAGVLAMEALHRQVLPFVLRRMKEDVLNDLPPKIIQDYYCDLSPLQARLYEDFAKSQMKKNLEKTLTSEATDVTQKQNMATGHVFQALQYLRKVCNHPKLVLLPTHPEFQTITEELQKQDSTLSEVTHAAKLVALKQLLLDSGIGNVSATTSATEDVVSQHRALIFCQLKSMLDIVEKDLLKTIMPSVTYLRLDGSIPPGQRHSVVHRFNNDPSIDVLLLTTQVGGLGLNLTGADTVIFVEHDWNPMKDLQAMDRAHRIGQKKVVNVYRLITTGTLEEKIMSLQKFKLTIANTVITSDNSSLQTMATDQLLDLFNFDNSDHRLNDERNDGQTTAKAIIENLPELWDNQDYESEYDLDSFLLKLRK